MLGFFQHLPASRRETGRAPHMCCLLFCARIVGHLQAVDERGHELSIATWRVLFVRQPLALLRGTWIVFPAAGAEVPVLPPRGRLGNSDAA